VHDNDICYATLLTGISMRTRTTIAALLFLTGILTSSLALPVERISVVGLFKDMAVVMIDGRQYTLRAGDTSPEGVTLVRADSNEAVMEFRGEQQSYGLGMHSGLFDGPVGGNIVRILPDASGMYRINGSINGFNMNFVVDTGATLVAMNSNEARRLGINYQADGEEALAQTASGTTRVYTINLDRVRVGDIELRNVGGAVHEGDHPPVVLLGNSFLNEVNLKRDGRVLELHKKRY
jgi:aspartyl protease family protein